MPEIDLSSPKNIHVIGVGGSGMSAIATVLVAMGHQVSGSDASSSPALDRVISAGVDAWDGHDGAKLPADTEAVAISTAVGETNPEVVEARRRAIPVLRRAEILSAIAATRRTVAVAGTHGKTTTSTFTALVLEAGGLKPSWIIGGELLGRGTGAHWDTGDLFVVEADESDGTFLELNAECVIVTNVEPDHLEYYGGWENLVSAFDKFVEQAHGQRVVCIDDIGAAALAKRFDVTTYGTHPDADWRITDLELGRFDVTFAVVGDKTSIKVQLPTPGLHNVRNATAALVLGHNLGVPLELGAEGLANYGGVGRRFQRRGEAGGVTFVDDYAHLPSEVKAAVGAGVDGDWQRVVAVFRPQRNSRTEQVGADFGGAFDGVDLVVLTGVYAAGEPERPGITGEIVRRAVEAEPNHPEVIYVEDRPDLAEAVAAVLRSGDLCLTLGAGDITKLADEVIALL